MAVVPALAAGGVPAAAAPLPSESVTCVAKNPDGGSVAYFGYALDGTDPVTIPAGQRTSPYNYFTTGDANRGQPSDFLPGPTRIAVRVPFTSSSVTWRLNGGASATATEFGPTPTPSSPRCDFDVAASLRPDRAVARPGDRVEWLLTLRNAGKTPFPWRDVVLEPTGGLAIGAPVSPAPDELDTDAAVTLAAGSTLVTPGDCFGTVAPAVTATFGGRVSAADANPADNVARSPVTVACTVDAQLIAPFQRASYAVGDAIVRDATVVNVGQAPLPLAALAVTDSRLGPLAAAPDSPDVVAPGARVAFRATRTATAADCGILASTATLTVGDASGRYADADPSSNTWTGSTEVTCPATGAPAGGSPAPPTTGTTTTTGTVTRTGATGWTWTATTPRAARRGGRGIVRVTVRNTSRAPLRRVAAAISVPRRVIIAQKLARNDVRTGNTVWRRTAVVAPGATWTFTLKVRYPVQYKGVRRTLVRVYAAGKAPGRAVRVTRLR